MTGQNSLLFFSLFVCKQKEMNSSEPPAILIKWCKEKNGVRITKDYLKKWHQSRTSPSNNTETAYRHILNDFLNEDISDTSEPVIQDTFGDSDLETFPLGHLRQGGGVVLQIQDTIDISHSTLSLLKSISNLTLVRQTYRERGENEEVEFPRGILRWTLSDGHKQIQAMEMETIPTLNLKTPFGTKVI